MTFNLDVSNQVQQVFFSKKAHKLSHSSVPFNTIPVQKHSTRQHFGVYLDENLNFKKIEKIGKLARGLELSKNCKKVFQEIS